MGYHKALDKFMRTSNIMAGPSNSGLVKSLFHRLQMVTLNIS